MIIRHSLYTVVFGNYTKFFIHEIRSKGVFGRGFSIVSTYIFAVLGNKWALRNRLSRQQTAETHVKSR